MPTYFCFGMTIAVMFSEAPFETYAHGPLPTLATVTPPPPAPPVPTAARRVRVGRLGAADFIERGGVRVLVVVSDRVLDLLRVIR